MSPHLLQIVYLMQLQAIVFLLSSVTTSRSRSKMNWTILNSVSSSSRPMPSKRTLWSIYWETSTEMNGPCCGKDWKPWLAILSTSIPQNLTMLLTWFGEPSLGGCPRWSCHFTRKSISLGLSKVEQKRTGIRSLSTNLLWCKDIKRISSLLTDYFEDDIDRWLHC